MNPTRSEAIKRFLSISTHKDLADSYNIAMECQVNVGQDGGEPVEGEYLGKHWRGWRGPSGETWKPFRIPYNANTEPTYEDRTMTFDLAAHAEGVGMTGWDWQNRLSRWVGFDFDAITGHSDKHTRKLSDSELTQVKEIVSSIPWVTLRRSTGGKGLHVYVYLTPVPTSNHNEHAALARAILGQLSGLCGVDFKAKVDVCGGNMWVWHRKMTGTNGLELIKQGTLFEDIPPHWRDHLEVVKGVRRKAIPFFVNEIKQPGSEDIFEQLSGQRVIIQLDEEHLRFLNLIKEISRGSSWWDSDHHMLVTHTILVKEASESLQLKGKFETVATGRQKGADHNCFCFPLRRGAWTVRRYTPGVAEAPSWQQDGVGFTRCYLNREPDLSVASRTYEGKEHPAGGYVFNTAEQASKAAEMLGANLDLPNFLIMRKTRLKQHPKDGRLIAEVGHENNDPADAKMASWIPEKGSWKKVFSVKVAAPVETETTNLDDSIRHVTTESGNDMGWSVKADNMWREEPLTHVKPTLLTMGYKPNEVSMVIGSSIMRPWTIVNRPFQPEYPGNREWNKDAPQMRFKPAEEELLQYPTWKKILTHCGKGLDDTIRNHPWCLSNGITSGAEYLMCWIGSLFQEPMQPLPYIFFWSSDQNTGKSTFHEAIQLLLTSGYVRADAALTSSGNFNGELLNSVLCVVEETDMKKNTAAYNKIKDWVTSVKLPIHIKGRTPYLVTNTTHWIQCANSHLACPVFSGDSRITMIHVPPLEPMDMVPKKFLIPMLEKEASHFLAAIKNLELPESNDRLNVPVITTEEKIHVQDANKTFLEMFIDERCHHVTGEVILYGDFYDRFREWLDPSQYTYWTKIRVGRELPPHFPKGKLRSSPHYHIGNISWEARKPDSPIKPRFVQRTSELIETVEGGNGNAHQARAR